MLLAGLALRPTGCQRLLTITAEDKTRQRELYIAWALLLGVAGLHVAAWRHEVKHGDQLADQAAWEEVCKVKDMREGFAKIIRLTTGERVAVFRNEGTLSAISNHCAHQNGH